MLPTSAINWWIISTRLRTKPCTALAKHLITKTSRPAINSVCLCLAWGQWICLTASLAAPPRKKKNGAEVAEEEQRNLPLCCWNLYPLSDPPPPYFVSALQKVARSSLSLLCWWCWVLEPCINMFLFISCNPIARPPHHLPSSFRPLSDPLHSA